MVFHKGIKLPLEREKALMHANKYILFIIFGLKERPGILVFPVYSYPFHLE